MTHQVHATENSTLSVGTRGPAFENGRQDPHLVDVPEPSALLREQLFQMKREVPWIGKLRPTGRTRLR